MLEGMFILLGYVTIFAFGIVIGSFLNVCIYRQPKQESVLHPSHCMKCGYELRWYDLVPLFSYLILRGRCRKCKTKLSLQYPLVEGMNGALYVIVFLANGYNYLSVVYCLLTSALIVLTVIDWRTYIIPNKVNLFIFILGVVATALDYTNWKEHMIGMVSVGGFLLLLYLVSVGRAIGGGDVKLMFGVGLIVGWKLTLLSFLIGCVLASVIHVIRMKVSGAEHRLAMGPYLAMGIWFSMLFGMPIVDWYFRVCGLV